MVNTFVHQGHCSHKGMMTVIRVIDTGNDLHDDTLHRRCKLHLQYERVADEMRDYALDVLSRVS